MTTLAPLDRRHQNRTRVDLSAPPQGGEAALFRALAPLRDEWTLTHWERWTVVVPFVDLDDPAVVDQIRRSLASAEAATAASSYTAPPPGEPAAEPLVIDGQAVPDLYALRGKADFPVAAETGVDQTTLTYASAIDKAELSVVALFTPEPGGTGAALRRAELGSSPERSSAAGPVSAIGNVATIDAGAALLTMSLVAAPEPPDAPSRRLEATVARLAPFA
jgi:hypothetical protein